MYTQDQKDKKISAAEKALTDVEAKLTKATDRRDNLERTFEETRVALDERITALSAEQTTAAEQIEWLKGMPVTAAAPVAAE